MLHPFLLRKLNYIKRHNQSNIDKGSIPCLSIVDLDYPIGLAKDQKHDLKDLIINGSCCFYNDEGDIESLTIDTFGEVSNSVKFPNLLHLEITNNKILI